MKRIVYFFAICLLTCISCNDDDDINISSGELQLQLPTELSESKVERLIAEIENVNTGLVVKKEMTDLTLVNINLEDGLYNIVVRGMITYQTSYMVKDEIVTQSVTSRVRGAKENIEIKGENFAVNIPLFLVNKSSDFVISEIFFSWTKTPEGKPYFYDSFFELYNNTDKVLYADGLCIGETKLKTTHSLENFTPDIRNEAAILRTVYRIPGSGKEHPVKPGETFVFCDIARNHKIENSNSIDLSKANFEWYDENKRDTDTPEAPNMEHLVTENARVAWKPFSRGQHSYVLFRVPNKVPAEAFANNHSFSYEFSLKGKTYTKKGWKIANSEVIDAVECSTPSAFEWKALSPSLDLTWTHSGDADDARYGHSVKRKISHKEGERIVLQDTNDSASDFIPTAPNPSPGTVADHK